MLWESFHLHLGSYPPLLEVFFFFLNEYKSYLKGPFCSCFLPLSPSLLLSIFAKIFFTLEILIVLDSLNSQLCLLQLLRSEGCDLASSFCIII